MDIIVWIEIKIKDIKICKSGGPDDCYFRIFKYLQMKSQNLATQVLFAFLKNNKKPNKKPDNNKKTPHKPTPEQGYQLARN